MRWLRVEGSSGVGKTSFARAGVCGAVLRGACGGPIDWSVVAFRPGLDPMRAIVQALVDAFSQRFDAATIEAAIDDATKTVADIQTVISREHENTHGNFLNDPALVTKLVNRLNGNQMYQALNTMRTDWEANSSLFRLNVLRRAGGASAGNVQEMVRGSDVLDLPGIYADATLMAFLKTKTNGGPLALFRHEAMALSADAEASADFMNWLLADTGALEVLRVLAATARASLITTLTALPTGWTWLTSLPPGPGLTPRSPR